MLKTRILTALVLIPAVLAALFLLPPIGWALVTLAIIALAAHEWSRLTGFASAPRLAFVGATLLIGFVMLFAPAVAFAQGWPEDVVFAVCGVATVFWLLVAPPWVIRRWTTRSPSTMAVVGWIVLIGAWVALVQLQARGPWFVLAGMATVWIADTAAYFTGRAFGRHKLAPSVSPGKTWEGVYGALAAVTVYALALSTLAPAAGMRWPLTVQVKAIIVLFALLLAGVSIVGDLFESLQKRIAGVKDSGRVLPGHGGVLDRVDALVAAMPLAALAAQLSLTGMHG
jgi:phosphatidate cytidylyltransferase